MQEKVDSKSDSLVVQNAMNVDKEEIAQLRKQVDGYNTGYNLTVGRLETFVNKHEAEIVGLRVKVDGLSEKVAKMQAEEANGATELKQLKDVRVEKLVSEIGALRERIVILETLLKGSEPKK